MKITRIPAHPSPMLPFLYAMNIATLATWLSIGCFGTVAIMVPVPEEIIRLDDLSDAADGSETSTTLMDDFTMVDLPPSPDTASGETAMAADTEIPLTEPEPLPTPPEMPETAAIIPLPEVPDIPSPSPRESIAQTMPQQRAVPAIKSPRSSRPANETGASVKGKETATGKSNNGSGISDAQRLAGGRMPAPSYPSFARSRGQQGTVLVEFVVGENGSVVSAYAKTPSPWPVLNDQAVSCVRTWKFPPGKVTKFVRPIIFKLN